MIVVCGEALIDLASVPGEPLAYRGTPGGGPANTAVALGRLGVPVALLARLSGDRFGQALRAHLTESQVDLRLAAHAAEPSTLAVVDVAPGGGAAYSFYLQGTADWQWRRNELTDLPAEAVALHSGSLAVALPPGSVEVRALLERERGHKTLSLDPNVRPALLGDPAEYRLRLEGLVALVDIVKASVEDAAWVYPDDSPAAVARRWQGLGARLVVLTAGNEGSTAWLGDDQVTVRAESVDVVDTVGAGDTFTAGLLGWLHGHGRLALADMPRLSARELAEALRLASRLSALVCARPGADPPWRGELPAGLL